MAHELPADYQPPRVGSRDDVGGYSGPWGSAPYAMCMHKWTGWTCTLPKGHACGFHVAHVGTQVCAVLLAPDWQYLQLPEGL